MHLVLGFAKEFDDSNDVIRGFVKSRKDLILGKRDRARPRFSSLDFDETQSAFRIDIFSQIVSWLLLSLLFLPGTINDSVFLNTLPKVKNVHFFES